MIKIFPLWFRVARFYVKARKVNKNKQLTNEEKVAKLHRLEAKYIGDEMPEIGEEKTSNTAVAIGMKDIAGEYCELNCSDDCLRFSLPAWEYFSRCKNFDSHMIAGFYFALLYSGKAYAQQLVLEKSCSIFDKMNELINKAIERQPDNARLLEMQKYGYGEAYWAFVDLYNATPREQRANVQNVVLEALQRWEKQDPGNEKLVRLIEKWQS